MTDTAQQEVNRQTSLKYPMSRGGGVFLTLIGAALIAAIAFRGQALVSYWVFFIGAGIATVSLFIASRFRHGNPTRSQRLALTFALSLEVVLFILMGRLLPHGTTEQERWMWVLTIVGVHFLPMALSFGPTLLILGGACIANAVIGMSMPHVPFHVFGLLDGCLKVGAGVWLLANYPRRPTN